MGKAGQGREEVKEKLQLGTRTKRRKAQGNKQIPISSQIPEGLSGNLFFFFQDILMTTEMGVILRRQSLPPALADFYPHRCPLLSSSLFFSISSRAQTPC